MATGRIIRQGRKELSSSTSKGGVVRSSSTSTTPQQTTSSQQLDVSLFGTTQAPNTAVITRAATGNTQYIQNNRTIATGTPVQQQTSSPPSLFSSPKTKQEI